MLAPRSFLGQGRGPEARVPQIDPQNILDVNARWLVEVVEAFGICPFARQAREQGRVQREVLTAEMDAVPGALTAAMVAMHLREDAPGEILEIGLQICPTYSGSATDFERLVRQCDDEANTLVRAEGRTPQYYVVAFHPEMAYSAADPQKLVGFWRRTPHPTVQFVQIPSLNRIRGTQVPTKYVDPDDHAAVQALLGQQVTGDLADRIALANWRTFHTHTDLLREKSEQLLSLSEGG